MSRVEISLHDAGGRVWLDVLEKQSHGRHGFMPRAALGDHLLNPVDEMVNEERRLEVWKAISQLPQRQRQAITKLFGLDGGGQRTLAEVAKEMGDITPQRVAQLRDGGFERLRTKRKLAVLL